MAAQHNVKCLYCGQVFDAKEEDKDIVWYKPRTNRYAHISCGKQADSTKSQEEKDFDELYRYVKDEQKAVLINPFAMPKFTLTGEDFKKARNR